MTNPPFFSVIVPTYNRKDLLKATLESILSQTFESHQIIVVDNCSSDGTEEMMHGQYSKKNIKYIRNPQNYERGFSRNLGLSMADGRYATFLDADDLMRSSCLQTVFDYLTRNPDARFLKIAHATYDSTTQEIKESVHVHDKNPLRALCKSNFISCIGVFLHTSISHQVVFSEDPLFVGSEDWLVWFKPLALNKLHYIPSFELLVMDHPSRSVYGHIYDNLAYQLRVFLTVISEDTFLRNLYFQHRRYIISNYTYHQAIHMLSKRCYAKSVALLITSIVHNPALLLTSRPYAILVSGLRTILK